MQTVKVFNKTERSTVWMDGDLESPELVPMKWVAGVPAQLARQFAHRDYFSVDWTVEKTRRRRPQPLYTPDGKQHLMLATPVSHATGYGYLGMKIIETLATRDNLKLSTSQLAYWDQNTPSHIKDILGQEQEICEWALAVTIPGELPNIPARNIVLYSMWETRELPQSDIPGDDWASLINNWAKVLIVPCDEQKQIFEQAGVTIPIHTIGIGLDVDTFKPDPNQPKADEFTVWLHGKLTSRKSPIELMTDVMWPALGKFDDWKLRYKTWGGVLGGGKFFPMINDDRIEVINQAMPAEEMAREMRAAHVGVYLSKYEGWGMPFREAMASGLITLVSETSGHIVDCNPEYNHPIPITGTADAGDGYDGAWDVPDWEAAAGVIRDLYDNWKADTLPDMGIQASHWIRQRRSWDKMVDDLMDIVDETHDRISK